MRTRVERRAVELHVETRKYLYLAKADPYLGAAQPAATLAERVEALVSPENAKWFTAQSATPKNQGS